MTEGALGWPAVPHGGRLYVLVADLMDRSRVAAARPDAVFLPNGPAGLQRLGELEPADVVLVDLRRAGVLAALATCAAPVMGFVAHVDEDLARQAATAGATEVLARSVFFRRLAPPRPA